MTWGYLTSAWPVMANVLAQDGMAYAGAGMLGQLDGLVLVALDSQSGKPKWEKRFDQGNDAPSAAGQLAWYQGKLWWHVGISGMLVIDPATGESKPCTDGSHIPARDLEPAWRLAMGQDIGVVPGGWVVCGGRFFNSPANSTTMRDGGLGLFCKADPSGVAKDGELFALPTLHGTESIPVWDEKGLLLFGRRSGWKTEALSPVLVPALDVLASSASATTTKGSRFSELTPTLAEGQNLLPPLKSLARPGYTWMTPVLAANAIAILNREYKPTAPWHVTCLSRETGASVWDVQLPALPVFGGMSMTCADDVLVPLVDGRVVCIGAP